MNELIISLFSDFEVDGIKVPVKYAYYHGDATDYVTFREVDAFNSLSGDDELIGYADYYDFDFFSHNGGNFKGNYLPIIESVKAILKQNYFTWQPSRSSADMYETDTGYYHKTLCFAIEREENN